MTLSDILTYAVYLLRDPLHGIWSTTELTGYANEALEDLSRDTKYAEDYRDYALTSGTATYDTDDDVVEIERVEYNGKHILPLTLDQMYEYDSGWLSESGEIRRWYPLGTGKIGYYKKPSWTADPSTISAEIGFTVDMSGGGNTYSLSSEVGIVVDIESYGTDTFYFAPDNQYGDIFFTDEDALTVSHRVVYTPATLVNSGDIPDLPTWFHPALVYYSCWKALDRDSPARNEGLATIWQALYADMKDLLFRLYNKAYRSGDRNLDIRPLTRSNKYRHFVTGSY